MSHSQSSAVYTKIAKSFVLNFQSMQFNINMLQDLYQKCLPCHLCNIWGKINSCRISFFSEIIHPFASVVKVSWTYSRIDWMPAVAASNVDLLNKWCYLSIYMVKVLKTKRRNKCNLHVRIHRKENRLDSLYF